MGSPPKTRVVVCAAIRSAHHRQIICGARHYDGVMHSQLMNSTTDFLVAEQGFIDQYGKFMTREEAWAVASYAGQIAYRVSGDEGKLFSENLY